MSDISQGNFAKIILKPGDSVRVTTGGVASVESRYGAPAGTTTVTANSATFGPYNVEASLKVTATSGTVSVVQIGAESAASASAVVGAASVPTAVYEYNDDGTLRKRAMPKRSRIVQNGDLMWWPTATPTSVGANATVALTAAGFLASNSGNGSGAWNQSVQINYNTVGFTDVVYSGLALAAPTTGLMQMMVWVEDIDTQGGAASAFAGSWYILMSLSNGGTTGFKFSTSAIRPGWNTIQLWDASDADMQAVFNRTGVSEGSATAPNFASAPNITSITFRAANAAASTKVRIGGLYKQTVVKPMVLVTFDTSSPDVFANAGPAFAAKGLGISMRSGGSDAYRDINFFDIPFWQKALAALDQGHDIYNGSWSRLGLSPGSTAAQFAAEVALHGNWMQRRGLNRGSCLFSSAGNGIPAASVYRSLAPQLGVTIMKSVYGIGLIKTIGPAGLDDRLAITCTGFPGRSKALQQLRVLEKTGGILIWFGHECPSAGAEPPPDQASPGSGGGMYAEDAVYLANYMTGRQDAGALSVVTASQLSDILDGVL